MASMRSVQKPGKMAKVQHIFWDWNGTLYDDVHVCVAALNGMLARRQKPSITVDLYTEVFSFPVKQVYPKLGFNMADENWDRMAREYHDEYLSRTGDCRLRDGSLDVLNALRQAGVPMSVVSACETGILLDLLDRAKVRDYFQNIRGLSDLFAASKLDITRTLIAALAADPRAVLLVGDTLHDHEIADILGCRCALLTGGHQTEERLSASGCAVLHDVRDVIRYFDMAP
mgnify:CR=1 FL=1